MKKKISKLWGLGLTFVMVVSLMLVAAPTPVSAADPVINEWDTAAFPDQGEDGDWFWDPNIGSVGPIAEATNGDLYAAVNWEHLDGSFSSANGTIDINGTCDPEGTYVEDVNGTVSGIANGTYNIVFDFCFTDGFNGTVHACSTLNVTSSTDYLDKEGVIVSEDVSSLTGSWSVTGGSFTMYPDGKFNGTYTVEGDTFDFCGDYSIGSSLMKSTDGGRTWSESSDTDKYAGGKIVDMVCSSIEEDTLYLTDGEYVYKSDDAGDTFSLVSDEALEKALMGDCAHLSPVLMSAIRMRTPLSSSAPVPFVLTIVIPITLLVG